MGAPTRKRFPGLGVPRKKDAKSKIALSFCKLSTSEPYPCYSEILDPRRSLAGENDTLS